jgi:glutaredoxin 3
MAAKVIIYGKVGWPYTEKAREAYGAEAEYIDVKVNAGKLEEMLKLSKGKRKVPVIVEGEKVTVGYGGSWGV